MDFLDTLYLGLHWIKHFALNYDLNWDIVMVKVYNLFMLMSLFLKYYVAVSDFIKAVFKIMLFFLFLL